MHEVATGQRITTHADERRLVQDGVLPVRNSRGGFNQNPAAQNDPAAIAKYYKHEPDYPNLMHAVDPKTKEYNNIAAFSGKMLNRPLKDGEQIFRFFGPPRTTHGVAVDEAWAAGAWWGLGPPPRTAKEWREMAAVLDSFNGDGFFVTAKIVNGKGPKAVVGTVSEQFGKKIPGQYLPGGATQAFFFLESSVKDALNKAGQTFANDGKVNKIVDPATGIEFTFHATGWTDANGIWGYVRGPGTTATQTARLGAREQASKHNEEVAIYP